MRITLFYTLYVLFSISSCLAQEDINNLSLNKDYNMSPSPNYKLTNGNDYKALTDGEKKTGSKFWQNTSTVGWSRAEKVIIDIDLNIKKNIHKININTARGKSAEVHYPSNILVFFSNDDKQYFFAGDVMDDINNKSGNYQVHEFQSDPINLSARYVKLVIIPNGRYTFIDEIEVLTSSKVNYQELYQLPPIKTEELENVSKIIIEKNRNRIQAFNQVKLNLEKVNNISGKKTSKKQLANLYSKSKKELDIENLKIKEELSGLLSNRNKGESILIDALSVWDSWSFGYPKNNTEIEFNLTLLENMYGYRAFSLTNVSKINQSLKVESSCDRTDVFEVPYSPSISERGVWDALLPIESKQFESSLAPGEQKVFFIKIKAVKDCIGELSIRFNDNIKTIPIILNVINTSNDEKYLNANVWAYLDYPVINNNKKWVSDDLKEHNINVLVVNGKHIPDVGGNDLSNLTSYLKNFTLTPETKVLLFKSFLHERNRKSIHDEMFLSCQWKSTFQEWYESLLNSLKKLNIQPNQVYWYPYDEITQADIKDFESLNRWASTAVKGFQSFVTIHKKNAIGAVEYATISQITPDLISIAKKNYPASEIWAYQVIDNSRNQHPYRTYRLMAWKAFLSGAEGIGFWNYLNLRNGNENIYFGNIEKRSDDYQVVYTDGENRILSSRRWEAFSKGLDDYRIIQMYAEKHGSKKTRDIVENVLNNDQDSRLADKVINEMLQSLK